MVNDTISNQALFELLEIENYACAIADSSKKIIWYSKSFKDSLNEKRIKGKDFLNLFPGINSEEFQSSRLTNEIFIPDLNCKLKIKQLQTDDGGYAIALIKNDVNLDELQPETETHELSTLFQKELNDILALLIKEKSLKVLSEEILSRTVNVLKGFFGLIVFQNDNRQFDYLWYDPEEIYTNKNDLQKELSSSFSFVAKWLSVNKRSLHALNKPNNIAFNLTKSFTCESLVISPCVFDNNLSAALITGKKDEIFQPHEINILDQFAALISFAISSIRIKELNDALENRLLQAQKLETIGKLSSGMAHDFSNLLSSIFGSLNLLKKRVPQNEDVFRLLDNIENCSIRAKDLTKGLLSFGKPTPRRKELIKPNLLMSEISKVIVQTFPKRIEFESNVEENLYDILGNGTEIYQILLNLCVNAKEAIEDRGKITLTAKNITVSQDNLMKYPLLAKGNYVHFSVTDNGSGISEENLSKIFDPYFSTKVKETGSGLGLYVTYGIIKAHQGHVEVSSKPGEFTTFDVFLPSFEPNLKTEITEPSEKIILLADDEIMLRDLLAELLESSGYNVIKVLSGIEAIRVLTEEIKVDLVILDYNMPQMNGVECVEKIRELGFNMPIILSSGSFSLEGKLDLSEVKVNTILTKPYEFDTMLSTIQKLI